MRRRGPWSSAWRGQRGTALLMTVIVLPVLLLLLLGIVDLSMMAYYKAQVRSAATSAALSAVGNQQHWRIPIPTRWVVILVPIPVDGWILNTLWLPDVDNLGPLQGETAAVAEMTGSGITLESTVYPRVIPAPIKWVKITARVDPPGLFRRVFAPGPIEHSACAIAWMRPDYWRHRWWDDKTLKSVFHQGNEPQHYYRLIKCGGDSPAAIVEAMVVAHLAATGENTAIGSLAAEYLDIQRESESHRNREPGGAGEERLGPASPAEVKECQAVGADRCKAPPQTVHCLDSNYSFTVEPQPYVPGQRYPTVDELRAERCPPPPPPPEETGDAGDADSAAPTEETAGHAEPAPSTGEVDP